MRTQPLSGTLLIIALMISFASAGQTHRITTVKTASDILFAAVDRPGELYLVSSTGIGKFGIDGEHLAFSVEPSTPTIFDPRDGARLFAYYRDRQEFTYLTPDLTVLATHKIDPAFAISPHLVCPAGDHDLVILDSADWSLRKVSTKTSDVRWEASIKEVLRSNANIIYMREYQNFIFVLDRYNGVLMFNSIGKFIRLLEVKGLSSFNFLGEELYYLDAGGKKVIFFDLFSAETRQMDLPSPCGAVLLTDERLFAVQGNAVEIFEFKP